MLWTFVTLTLYYACSRIQSQGRGSRIGSKLLLITYCMPDPELVNCQAYKDEPDTVLADQLESWSNAQEPHWKCGGRRNFTACGHMRRDDQFCWSVRGSFSGEGNVLEKVNPEFTRWGSDGKRRKGGKRRHPGWRDQTIQIVWCEKIVYKTSC